jgi:hypothetical protein
MTTARDASGGAPPHRPDPAAIKRPGQEIKQLGLLLFTAVAALLLLIPTASRAQVAYQFQPIIRQGDPVANTRVRDDGAFLIGGLNDNGQMLFAADSAAGGQMLLQSGSSIFAPLVVSGAAAPGGQWSGRTILRLPLSMNRQGSAVFPADVKVGHRSTAGIFRWDYPAHQMISVALKGTAALDTLLFEVSDGSPVVLNNSGDIALAVAVSDTAGQEAAQNGVFFLGRDGQLLPVALPGQVLPDGPTAAWASFPSLDDTGRVACLVRPRNDDRSLPYVWEHGALTPLPTSSVTAPPWTLLYGFIGIWLNNKNRNALLAAHLHSLAGHFYGIYLLTGDTPTPVAVLGQEMPGGGRFLTLQDQGVSDANAAGQHAFLATLEDGTTAAYLMDAGGAVSLLLASGAVTSLGTVANVGQGMGQSQGGSP